MNNENRDPDNMHARGPANKEELLNRGAMLANPELYLKQNTTSTWEVKRLILDKSHELWQEILVEITSINDYIVYTEHGVHLKSDLAAETYFHEALDRIVKDWMEHRRLTVAAKVLNEVV